MVHSQSQSTSLGGGRAGKKIFSFRRAHRYRSEHSQPTTLSTSLYDNMII